MSETLTETVVDAPAEPVVSSPPAEPVSPSPIELFDAPPPATPATVIAPVVILGIAVVGWIVFTEAMIGMRQRLAGVSTSRRPPVMAVRDFSGTPAYDEIADWEELPIAKPIEIPPKVDRQIGQSAKAESSEAGGPIEVVASQPAAVAAPADASPRSIERRRDMADPTDRKVSPLFRAATF
jgi:hypothetical protein